MVVIEREIERKKKRRKNIQAGEAEVAECGTEEIKRKFMSIS